MRHWTQSIPDLPESIRKKANRIKFLTRLRNFMADSIQEYDKLINEEGMELDKMVVDHGVSDKTIEEALKTDTCDLKEL